MSTMHMREFDVVPGSDILANDGARHWQAIKRGRNCIPIQIKRTTCCTVQMNLAGRLKLFQAACARGVVEDRDARLSAKVYQFLKRRIPVKRRVDQRSSYCTRTFRFD